MLISDEEDSAGHNVHLCDVAVLEITELFQVVVVAGMAGRGGEGGRQAATPISALRVTRKNIIYENILQS